MRMFDSFTTHIVVTILSFGVASVNIFFIYAIWKHSPKTMGKFKNYMLIMSLADFTFASSIAFLFLPNLLFPLPAGIVVGLLKYLGPIGGPLAYWISMSCGAWIMAAIWQCCLYRMYVFYQFDRLLEIANNWFGPLMVLEVVVLSSLMGAITYFNTATYQDLLEYAKRHGHTVPADINPYTPLVAFDLDKWNVNLGIVLIGLFLFGGGVCIGCLNVAVQKKINNSKSSMSKESYQMQKSLTVILLSQAMIPSVSVALPVLVYCIAIGFSLTNLLQSPILEWFAVLIIGAYPFVNSAFCLYYMKPYRRFTIRILQKVLWCYPWHGNVAAAVEPPRSSITQKEA